MATDETKVAVGYSAATAGYPVTFSVVYPQRLSRRKGVQRAVGALLTWAVPAGLGYVSAVFYFGLWIIIGSLIAFGVIIVPVALALRIRAGGMQRYLTRDAPTLERYARRALAAASYALFLTDSPPREAVDSVVKLRIASHVSGGWLRAAVTSVLLLPHILLLALFAFVFTLIVPVCAVSTIVFQRYPRPLFGFTVGYLRWIARALAFWISLTDRYPPLSFADA